MNEEQRSAFLGRGVIRSQENKFRRGLTARSVTNDVGPIRQAVIQVGASNQRERFQENLPLYEQRQGGSGRRELDADRLKYMLQWHPSGVLAYEGLNSKIGQLLEKEYVDYETMSLLVTLLEKICVSSTSSNNLNPIILAVHNSKFYVHVKRFLNDFAILQVDKKPFVRSLLGFMLELYVRLPHSILEVEVFAVESMLQDFVEDLSTGNCEDDEIILQRFVQLLSLKRSDLSSIESFRGEKKSPKNDEPPDDFHDIPIFPTMADINPNQKPFLRRNKTEGGYDSLNHYLDVQFRLLREDFVGPLREGINEYLSSVSRKKRSTNIRIYENVHIMKTVCGDSLCYKLSFDIGRLRHVRWETSKRLIFGSLVCLTEDNFKSALFATISQRVPDDLREGYIDVMFENAELVKDILPERQFVMVETPAFFEAYRHVLCGLQLVEELPFERYIVYCQKDVNPPKYMINEFPTYDLRPLVDNNIVLRADKTRQLQSRKENYDFSAESKPAEKVFILSDMNWPQANLLHLNDSQYEAVKTALTKEFAIIQGPPGTGKTYVGLKIVKALLHNLTKQPQRTLMLIVCYTNHALDQFLEGIASFFDGDILRVGSKISKDQLKKHSLEEHRKKKRSEPLKSSRKQKYFNMKVKLKQLEYEIEKTWMKLNVAEKSILHEDALKPFMGKHYKLIWENIKEVYDMMQLPEPKSFLLEWLGFENIELPPSKPAKRDARDELDVISAQEEAELEQERRQIEPLEVIDESDSHLTVLEKKIANLGKEGNNYDALQMRSIDEEHFQKTAAARKRNKQKLLQNLHSKLQMTEDQSLRVDDPWNLAMDDRWKLYRYWANKFSERVRAGINKIEHSYERVCAELKDHKLDEDKEIMQEATVVAMTTTGAARYHQVLAETRPQVVIVEEAAEVLEGHIITALNKYCEHLILIGDHKQLKPTPTVYKLAKQYCLDLSLFERMVSNGVHCDTLAIQHRMRPEISLPLRHIYPSLSDHPSVSQYENIRGMSQNIYFINHNNPEEQDVDLWSHSNTYEAKYIVALCGYLLKQGYDHSQITILTTYSGQFLKIKNSMPREPFQGVRLTTVDNYQGEENDIILLSLVRSNYHGSVGYLNIDNRVCVALSRAKMGFFVIGNFELLARHSTLWDDIVKTLTKHGQIGNTLDLFCQNHPNDARTSILSPEDFEKIPEGGCVKPCEFELPCGHVCTLPCHPSDIEHKEFKCKQACTATLCDENHKCPKKCFQKCGKCNVPVEKELSKCGHKQMVPCAVEVENVQCSVISEITLDCGHSREVVCGETDIKCALIVKKELPCGHEGDVHCYQDVDKFQCRKPCTDILECGHKCGKTCGSNEHECTAKVKKVFTCGHVKEILCRDREMTKCGAKCCEDLRCGHKCTGNCETCHQGKLHKSCGQPCQKPLVCGHKCRDRCSNCPPCNKMCDNYCSHRTCNRYCIQLCLPCNRPCDWECRHLKCTMSCSEPCNRPPCDEACPKLLQCGHPCIGLCGERCPIKCRICNKKDIFGSKDSPDARFVHLEDCSHIVEVTVLDRIMKEESQELKLKQCPECATPIRHNMRYGNKIKKILQDIEIVKSRIADSRHQIKSKREHLVKTVRALENRKLDVIQKIEKRIKNVKSLSELSAMENVITIADELFQIRCQYENLQKKLSGKGPNYEQLIAECLLDIKSFFVFLPKKRTVLTHQEEEDAQNELHRLRVGVRIIQLLTSPGASPEATNNALKLKDVILSGKPFTKERQIELRACLHAICEGLVRTENDTKTVNMSADQWSTCTKGHVIWRFATEDCDECLSEMMDSLWFE